MEGRKLKTILGVSLAVNVILVILSGLVGTMAYFGGLASCPVFGAANQVIDSVEGIDDTINDTIDNLPIPIDIK